MEGLTNPIDEILQEYRDAGSVRTITEEDRLEAEKQINGKMAEFSIEMRTYFNQSIEAARHAYLTF